MFELMDVDSQNAVIKVIGVGGGGGNAGRLSEPVATKWLCATLRHQADRRGPLPLEAG